MDKHAGALAGRAHPPAENERAARERLAARYRDLARECDAVRLPAFSPAVRAHYEKMAAHYRSLADRTLSEARVSAFAKTESEARVSAFAKAEIEAREKNEAPESLVGRRHPVWLRDILIAVGIVTALWLAANLIGFATHVFAGVPADIARHVGYSVASLGGIGIAIVIRCSRAPASAGRHANRITISRTNSSGNTTPNSSGA